MSRICDEEPNFYGPGIRIHDVVDMGNARRKMFIRVCVSKHIGPAAHGDKSQVALEYIGKNPDTREVCNGNERIDVRLHELPIRDLLFDDGAGE